MAHVDSASSAVFSSSGLGKNDSGDQLEMLPSRRASGLRQDHLVGLLQKASQTIQNERARFAALQQELNSMREPVIDSCLVSRLQKENRELKNQVLFLRGKIEEGHGRMQSKGNSLSSADCGDNVSLGPFATRGSTTSAAANTIGSGSYSEAHQRKKQVGLRNRCQWFLPGEKSKREASKALLRAEPGVQPQQKENQQLQRDLSAGDKKPRPLSRLCASSPPAECMGQTSVQHDCEKKYTVAMITKLRRAMAPQPTKEQLGEVIHAMVAEVVRDAHRRGFDLSLKRKAPCVYLCEYSAACLKKGRRAVSRVVHLSIDSGRLTVKMGGGHQNFLEYLERHCSIPL